MTFAGFHADVYIALKSRRHRESIATVTAAVNSNTQLLLRPLAFKADEHANTNSDRQFDPDFNGREIVPTGPSKLPQRMCLEKINSQYGYDTPAKIQREPRAQ